MKLMMIIWYDYLTSMVIWISWDNMGLQWVARFNGGYHTHTCSNRTKHHTTYPLVMTNIAIENHIFKSNQQNRWIIVKNHCSKVLEICRVTRADLKRASQTYTFSHVIQPKLNKLNMLVIPWPFSRANDDKVYENLGVPSIFIYFPTNSQDLKGILMDEGDLCHTKMGWEEPAKIQEFPILKFTKSTNICQFL